MNAIDYALRMIRLEIPEQILIEAMNINVPENMVYQTSTDEKIVSAIIRGIVLYRSNMVGGVKEDIDLSGLQPQRDYFNNVVWQVPLERTGYRSIVNPLGIGTGLIGLPPQGAGLQGGFGYGHIGINPGDDCCAVDNYATQVGDRIYSSRKGHMSDYNTNVRLIGPNTVMLLGGNLFLNQRLVLSAVVSYDENFNDLQPRALEDLGVISVLAAKAYIWNALHIPLNRGMLDSGQDLGVFADTVRSYEGSAELLNEYIKEHWGGVLYMNDNKKKYGFYARMMRPDL